MAINSYESFATYGAMDSDAFTDADVSGTTMLGKPYSAATLRTMALDHNRLLMKEEQLFNLIWPTVSTATSGDDVAMPTFGGNATPGWESIHPPIPVLKKYGHTKINIGLTVRVGEVTDVSSDANVQFQFATGAMPFDPTARSGDPNVISISNSTDDGFVEATASDVLVLPGQRDFLTVYVRGNLTASAPNTTTYGSPASGTFEFLGTEWMGDDQATWNITNATNVNLATGGFSVLFTDVSGNAVLAPRRITEVTLGVSGRGFYFQPALSLEEVEFAQGHGAYSIFAIPHWWISNITGYSVARSV